MQINKVKLKNFRCFEDQEFNLHPGVNLFIGSNAAGKTSILEALSVALGSFFLGIRDYDSRHIRPEDIRIVANHIQNSVTFEKTFPVEIHSSGIVMGEEIDWSRSLTSQKGRTNSKKATKIKEKAEKADNIVRNNSEEILLPLIAYYGNGRLWLEPRDIDKKNNFKDQLSRFMGYHLSIDPRCSPRELMRWMERQEKITFRDKKEPYLLQIVKKAISKCLEGVKTIGFDPEREEMAIEFKNGNELPFGYLSDGQRGVAAMVGDIAMRAAMLNPHLNLEVLNKTPGVVLIDEVDLYLHPRWQRNILHDLSSTFPEIQFICTSHSPQVIGEIEACRVINLDSSNNPSQTFGLDSNTIIEKVMGGLSRTKEISAILSHIEHCILKEEFNIAREKIEEARKLIKGTDKELIRFETIISNLEAIQNNELY